jgi:hypothetical protein
MPSLLRAAGVRQSEFMIFRKTYNCKSLAAEEKPPKQIIRALVLASQIWRPDGSVWAVRMRF